VRKSQARSVRRDIACFGPKPKGATSRIAQSVHRRGGSVPRGTSGSEPAANGRNHRLSHALLASRFRRWNGSSDLMAIMVMQPYYAAGRRRWTGLVLALWLSSLGAIHSQARGPGPFADLAGHWTGSGTIDLSGGAREPIRCRAAYDVLDQQKNLQLDIRCASQSYYFNLLASAKYHGGILSGTWSESTRNAAGTITGSAAGDRVEVTAKSPSFVARLTLTTHGDRQSVIIKSRKAKARVEGASITLRRRS
jgi:hypothetical protein